MNEPQNNSIVSTIIFLCIAALIIFAIALLSENFAPKTSDNINSQTTQTK